MKTILVVGDSYSAAREGDTGLDRGWPVDLGVTDGFRQGVSGSTAGQWASDLNGMLTKGKATQSDVLILSLLGNDAFAIESQGFSNISLSMAEASRAVGEFKSVLKSLQRPETFILLYPDPFNGAHEDFNAALPVLRGAIREAVSQFQGITLVDLSAILEPSDFNGSDIHPIQSGHAKIAAHFKSLIC